MRRGAIAEVEHDLVHVTPSPAFGWVIAFDDRMARLVKMLGGVAVRRVVATPDMAAGPAQAQMQPRRLNLQTFLAAESAGCYVANGVFMGCFLVILGLVPGLLYWISDQLQQVGKSFSPSLLDASRRQGMPYGGLPRPLWLAGRPPAGLR